MFEEKDGRIRGLRYQDPCILVSDDGGDTWHLEVAQNFVNGIRRFGSESEGGKAGKSEGFKVVESGVIRIEVKTAHLKFANRT